MNPTTWAWHHVDSRARIVGMERRTDHVIPVFRLHFNITRSTTWFLNPDTSQESSPVTSFPELTVPMRNFVDLGTAYRHSHHMLSTISVVEPDAIPAVLPGIAPKLCSLSRHAGIRRGLINSVHVEIRLNIKYCYIDAAAALDWAMRESMENMRPLVSRGLLGSSSSGEVEELLRSCRAETWDSKAQCAICLECLGGDEDEEEEGTEKEDEEVISLAGCSHLFHGACIRRWFEVSESCPLCRRTVRVGFRSM